MTESNTAVNLGAIDAGSNAIRVLVARAYSPTKIEEIYRRRYPIRLGHHTFIHNKLNNEIIAEAVRVFQHFAALFHRFKVNEYRAVATSATREASNRDNFLKKIRNRAGIHLEVIDGKEEARLTTLAVDACLNDKVKPVLVTDLGGGSLELNYQWKGKLEKVYTLPLGTVRIMDAFHVDGAINAGQQKQIEELIQLKLHKAISKRLDFSDQAVVSCGGNANTLARIAAATPLGKAAVLDLKKLKKVLPEILSINVAERIKKFGVRKDRAEVMGIAAITFIALGEWLNVKSFLVPDVGIREGIVQQLAESHFQLIAKR